MTTCFGIIFDKIMTRVNRICYSAFFVRLIALVAVMLFSKYLTSGFLSSDLVNDDVRYLMGAQNYAKIANSIIDVNALGSAYYDVGEWSATGYGFKLWYWIISISMYLFHSEFVVRFLNVLFGVASVRCIYDICNKLYGTQVASMASKLYAFLPYPVFFSCFLYKDQFYTLLVLMMFRFIFLKQERMKIKDLLRVSILLIISTFIRSGLSLLIAALLVIIYLKYAKKSISKGYSIIIIIIATIGTTVLWMYSSESIETKYIAYVVEYGSKGGNISLVSIKSITDIWKYPFALMFAMLMPVNNLGSVTSWFGLVGYLNIIILPVALGCIIYLINWGYKKDLFFWSVQVLYLVTIMTSLGIFRHHYYLQPYMMIFFSLFYLRLKEKKVYSIISAVLVVFYGMAIYILY